jgi:nicotinate-nucleotide pyrophosphorylase (carboxylating)
MLSPDAHRLIELALAEDLARGDVTSDAIFTPADQSRARFNAREPIVVSGLEVLAALCAEVDRSLLFEPLASDGDRLDSGASIATLSGPTASLLKAERSALNFLSRLSGVATLTSRCVAALGPGRTRLVDTRKTTPGWRVLEKAAVRHGGAGNHRNDLADGAMIKDNHIAACGSLTEAVRRVRAQAHHLLRIEVEVDTEEQLDEALSAGADVVMLDNFSNPRIAAAVLRVRAIRPQTLVEISGGVTEARLPGLQVLGADLVSMGALTHAARAVDIGLDLLREPGA